MLFSSVLFIICQTLSNLISPHNSVSNSDYACDCEECCIINSSLNISMSSFFRQLFSRLFTNTTERRRRRRSMSLGNDWSYWGDNGPENWHKNFPVAASEYQSPINIDTYEVIYDPALGDINFLGYHSVDKKQFFRLKNTGYTVKIDLRGEMQLIDCDNKCYEAFSLQFHWGGDNSRGSEHHLNMKTFPMEIHILHRNVKYNDSEEMLYKLDGMATIAVFVEIGSEENEGLGHFIDQFRFIKYGGQGVEIPAFPLASLLPLDTTKYYTYAGSLSAPPCNECNKWIVIRDPIKVSADQLDAFRQLMKMPENSAGQEFIIDNFRPVQPICRRTVTASLKLQDGSYNQVNFQE